jgi:hypothetical protein
MTNKINAINEHLFDVCLEAYKRGFTVQSDFAREQAEFVAMAASMHLITTHVMNNVFGREWRPTAKGFRFLQEMGIEDEEDDYIPTNHDIVEGEDFP